jgi:hypothetical protein
MADGSSSSAAHLILTFQAEEKGASASLYGLIIGMNCLTTFIVTPFIGKNVSLFAQRSP